MRDDSTRISGWFYSGSRSRVWAVGSIFMMEGACCMTSLILIDQLLYMWNPRDRQYCGDGWSWLC